MRPTLREANPQFAVVQPRPPLSPFDAEGKLTPEPQWLCASPRHRSDFPTHSACHSRKLCLGLINRLWFWYWASMYFTGAAKPVITPVSVSDSLSKTSRIKTWPVTRARQTILVGYVHSFVKVFVFDFHIASPCRSFPSIVPCSALQNGV